MTEAVATRGRPSSEVTARAVAFVAERRELAEVLGRELADVTGDPDEFAAGLTAAFERLSDPEYLVGQHFIAPGLGPVYGVRWPLHAAVARGFRAASRRESPARLLYVADRMFHEERLEARWFAFGLLERIVAADPERAWQLLRRAAREAGDWITVDSLAHPYGRGIIDEPYRWAELEQLVYSPSRWERRLVGSTIATIPYVDRRRGRSAEVARHALPILGQLLGDREPDVQKALAWAYRSLLVVDRPAVEAALSRETDVAASNRDGHRAWVIRDVLTKFDPGPAEVLRKRLAGIRKVAGAAATSSASAIAGRFGQLPDPGGHPEPPLT
ncbi:MAG TPA: DNA alkylation repair protein [Candidatus Limnocylindrales bacterium]